MLQKLYIVFKILKKIHISAFGVQTKQKYDTITRLFRYWISVDMLVKVYNT